MKRPLLLAFVLLAAALLWGGKVAQNAAIRSVVYQSMRTILRHVGIR